MDKREVWECNSNIGGALTVIVLIALALAVAEFISKFILWVI